MASVGSEISKIQNRAAWDFEILGPADAILVWDFEKLRISLQKHPGKLIAVNFNVRYGL